MTITAYAIRAGDLLTDCMVVTIVCSRDCAEAWLDENAPFDGGYDRVDVDASTMCSHCGDLIEGE